MLEGIDLSHWETATDWSADSRAGFHTRQYTEDNYA
jgi:GH25 family lysozyme M1 (1,4-beta-N-acetylmuramidase)